MSASVYRHVKTCLERHGIVPFIPNSSSLPVNEDDVCEMLREAIPRYRRIKFGLLRKHVSQALGQLRQSSNCTQAELLRSPRMPSSSSFSSTTDFNNDPASPCATLSDSSISCPSGTSACMNASLMSLYGRAVNPSAETKDNFHQQACPNNEEKSNECNKTNNEATSDAKEQNINLKRGEERNWSKQEDKKKALERTKTNGKKQKLSKARDSSSNSFSQAKGNYQRDRKGSMEVEEAFRSGNYGRSGQFEPEEIPDERLENLGGIENILADVNDLVIYPLRHPELFQHLGIQPPRGVLLHGPPGCGKTKLALAIAGESGASFYRVAGPELVSGMSGESESLLRALFSAAKQKSPSIIFIDEIDAIIPKREGASREMERRIVAQLGSCMDELAGCSVVVLGATNRPEALDAMIRRNGRFDREIAIGIPDQAARCKILRVISAGMRVAEDVDFDLLARMTPGFVGADLYAVLREAAIITVRRTFGNMPDKHKQISDEELEKVSIPWQDLKDAIKHVQPSAKREGFSTIPDVTWDDVGSLKALRKELEDRVCLPIKEAELYRHLGLDVPAGILLFGPPGCGKTLIAKAVANESGANFISIKGPELLNKYVGESERAVRLVFQRARVSSPCVIFFDELDSLCAKRGGEGGQASERVVNQLLTEMDGVQERRDVFVIAATNRPDIIDSAMLRPGRLDRLLYVPLPAESDRAEILRTVSRKTPLREDVDLRALAAKTEGYSGADLAALLREATMIALDETRNNRGISSFYNAISSASTSTKDTKESVSELKVSKSKDGDPCLNQGSFLHDKSRMPDGAATGECVETDAESTHSSAIHAGEHAQVVKNLVSQTAVAMKHFAAALQKVRASVTADKQIFYETYLKSFHDAND